MNYKAFAFLFLLLVLPAVSAVNISMDSNFSQGQTLIAQLSGNFISKVQVQNVLLYNGHVRVSFVPHVNNINSTYYIYGQLVNKPAGNYSLVISGVSYLNPLGQVQSDDISQDFVITNNTADFSVDPGFIETNGSFYISVQSFSNGNINLNYYLQNSSVPETTSASSIGFFGSLFGGSRTYSAPAGSSTVSVPSGQQQQVEFNTAGYSGLIAAALNDGNTSYYVPVLVLPALSAPPGRSLAILEIQPSKISVSMNTSSTTTRYVYIDNSGTQNATNVSVSVLGDAASYASVEGGPFEVDSNSTVRVPVDITAGDNESAVSGEIVTSYGGISIYTPVTLNFTSGYVAIPAINSSASLFETCAQMGGALCGANETCNGQTQDAADGTCCLGTCQAVKSGPSAANLVGWIIVLGVVGFLAWFFLKKYRKAKRPLNLMDIAKGKKPQQSPDKSKTPEKK